MMPLWFWELPWSSWNGCMPWGDNGLEHVEAKPTTRREEKRIFKSAMK